MLRITCSLNCALGLATHASYVTRNTLYRIYAAIGANDVVRDGEKRMKQDVKPQITQMNADSANPVHQSFVPRAYKTVFPLRTQSMKDASIVWISIALVEGRK